jgi:type I restriction enzyme S subunit
MKKYEKYKDSGINCIAEIPSHWGTRKFNNVSYMKGRIGWQGLKQTEFTTNEDDPFLITGMNFKDGVIRWNEVYHISYDRFNEAPEIQLKENDVLITKDGTIGKLLFIDTIPYPHKASLNSHLLVLRPLNNHYYQRYLYYQLQSECFTHHVELTKTGTTFFGITQEAMGEYKMILPPLTEQTAIATYLDRKTAEIDQLIDAKKRLIELYHEEKTAIINQAVTKGINPNAKMKDSGIEWLGEVPEHWEVSRMANFGKYSKGKGISKADITIEGVPVVLYGDIYTKYDISAMHFERTTSLEVAKKSVIICKGDLLFTASGETEEDIGKCIVYLGDEKAYAGGDVIIYKQLGNDSQFLSYLFNTYSVREQKAKLSKGEIVVHIYSSQLRDIKFPLPPLEEQQSIVHHIETECSRIDTKIERTQRLIELLAEYRTALISEVVTGKVKVV